MDEKRRVMVRNIDGSQEKECLKCGFIVKIGAGEKVSQCPACGFDIDHTPQISAREFERQGA